MVYRVRADLGKSRNFMVAFLGLESPGKFWKSVKLK